MPSVKSRRAGSFLFTSPACCGTLRAMYNSWILRGGRILDPVAGVDRVGDLYILDGILAPSPRPAPPDIPVWDAAGLVVAPGFIDLHVHLREPGDEEAETVASGCRAAARGGFTSLLAMPNTRPPIDSPERVRRLLGLASPSLASGQPADVTILDLLSEWTVLAADFASRSRNTPFEGLRVRGRAVATFRRGSIAWEARARPG